VGIPQGQRGIVSNIREYYSLTLFILSILHGVTLGCVEGDPETVLGMHIFAGSKASCEIIPDGVPQYEEWSPVNKPENTYESPGQKKRLSLLARPFASGDTKGNTVGVLSFKGNINRQKTNCSLNLCLCYCPYLLIQI